MYNTLIARLYFLNGNFLPFSVIFAFKISMQGAWFRSLGRFPGEGNGYPLWYSCLEKPMDRGAWVGYSPWSHKELDMTERLSIAQHSTANN